MFMSKVNTERGNAWYYVHSITIFKYVQLHTLWATFIWHIVVVWTTLCKKILCSKGCYRLKKKASSFFFCLLADQLHKSSTLSASLFWERERVSVSGKKLHICCGFESFSFCSAVNAEVHSITDKVFFSLHENQTLWSSWRLTSITSTGV